MSSVLSRLRIGSRRSDLARLQAQMVGMKLGTNQYVFKEAPGDVNLKDPLWKMPEMGVFTSFLRRYLVSREIDLVVHSWKDLPIEKDEFTEIVGTLPRADPRDLLLISKTALADAYKTGTLIVLSSSPRRKHNLPDFLRKSIPVGPNGERITNIEFRDVRGNIQTRLLKLCGPEKPEDPLTGEKFHPHGLVVAKAAIDRFLWAGTVLPEFAPTSDLVKHCISQCLWQVLPLSVNPTAAAQGALAVEMMEEPRDITVAVASTINHTPTFAAVNEERRILQSLGGGCHQKIGCTILKREYGKVTFLRGVTDVNQAEITVARIDGEHGWSKEEESRKQLDEKILSLCVQIGGKNGVQLFDRVDVAGAAKTVDDRLRTVSSEVGLMVAKSDALPLTVTDIGDDRPVWTAGTSTWYALASRGIWVNGSSDSLGESENPDIDWLTGTNTKWLKLTHTDSCKSADHCVGTYTLVPRNRAVDISGRKFFYFSSGSVFRELMRMHPDLVEEFRNGSKIAGCGPGNTWEYMKEAQVPVRVAYNFADFQRQIANS